MADIGATAKAALKDARLYALGAGAGVTRAEDIFVAVLAGASDARAALVGIGVDDSVLRRLTERPKASGLKSLRPLGFSDQAQAVVLSFASGNVAMEATSMAAALLEVDADLRELVRTWGVTPEDAVAALRGA